MKHRNARGGARCLLGAGGRFLLGTAFLLTLALSPAFAQVSGESAARAFFEGGVAAYRASEYRLAAGLFHDSVKAQPTTGALRNLGNSEWQRGRTGRAILAWEQAVWLDPFDRVARENLEFARKTAQIDAPELAWHEAASLYLPASWWAWLAGLSLWVAIGAAVLPGILRVRKVAWHQAVAAIGLAGFLLSLPAHFGIANRAKMGFILDRETPLRLTPTTESQAITRLTAGDPARVETRRGDFLLVRTSRARGWLHVDEFGAVCPRPFFRAEK